MEEFQDLLEPRKLYNTQLKDAFHRNAEEFFDDLTVKSNVDIESNRDTIKKINAQEVKISKLFKSKKQNNSFKGFLIFVIVLCFFLSFLGVLIGTTNNIIALAIVAPLVLIPCGILLIVYIKKSLNKKIKDLESLIKKEKQVQAEYLSEAANQMAALNELFDFNMIPELITKTIPLVQMDKPFDKEKFFYLRDKYGFKENEEDNISSVYIQSGSILGNPFIIERNYVRQIVQHTYTGSLTIHWTETYWDGKQTRTVTHTQTLTASVTKPKPEYYYDTWLVYSNDAAPDLHFSRQHTNANSMNEKQIEKYVKDFSKKLTKAVEKARGKGSSFTAMGNEEFEALFNAIDRDNDVQFRLLFTPLAQKSMLDLIKNKTPYGDDFTFVKNGPLNYISSIHSQNFDVDDTPGKFIGINYDSVKSFFINYCDEYFKCLYFDLAPLMSIPLYQQNQTFEYIYEGKFASNVTSFETEIMANALGDDGFKHPDSDTPAILKRTQVASQGKADRAIITAHSYKSIPHTDYIPVLGGDGNYHNVPVVWYEYDPLVQETEMSVQHVDTSRKEFNEKLSNGTINNFMSKYSTNNAIIYHRGLISFLAGPLNNGNTGEELDNIFKKEK